MTAAHRNPMWDISCMNDIVLAFLGCPLWSLKELSEDRICGPCRHSPRSLKLHEDRDSNWNVVPAGVQQGYL